MAKPTLDIEVRVALVENMVVQQNESIDKRLSNIERVLSEIHDKQDTHILNQAVTNERNDGRHEAQDLAILAVKGELDKTNGKIAKAAGIIASLVAAFITGAFEYFKK